MLLAGYLLVISGDVPAAACAAAFQPVRTQSGRRLKFCCADLLEPAASNGLFAGEPLRGAFRPFEPFAVVTSSLSLPARIRDLRPGIYSYRTA